MAAIHEAVAMRCGGAHREARHRLEDLWGRAGADGDPLHRCVLAHFLADAQDDAEASLAWNLRALAAADALDDARAQRHHASLSVRVLYPSLHLNLVEDYRALDRPTDARHHLRLGEAALDALDVQGEPDGVRAALSALRQRLDAQSEGACGARRS